MDLRDEIFFTLLLSLITAFFFKKLAFVSSASPHEEQDVAEASERPEESSPPSDAPHVEIAGDEEWEGIEKSEVAKLFSAAAEFVCSDLGKETVSSLDDDLQMKLLSLHRIALEGPCYESSPLSLKASSRANWHAWEKLGRVNLEEAMEKYVSIISDNIPNWRDLKEEGLRK